MTALTDVFDVLVADVVPHSGGSHIVLVGCFLDRDAIGAHFSRNASSVRCRSTDYHPRTRQGRGATDDCDTDTCGL